MNRTLHTHTLYSLLTCLLMATFTACLENNADDANPRLKVSTTNINVIQTGTLSTGVNANFEIIANLGYKIISDVDWIAPNNSEGKGAVDIVLNISANETGNTRVGHLTVKSHNLSEIITIVQTMVPDTDDGEETGHTYMNEDFSFCEQFGGQDQVTYPDQSSTVPVRSQEEAIKYFEDHGYAEYNYDGNCMYMAKHYLKMGKKNRQNGLCIQLQNIKPGKSTNITLTFDAAPVVTINGTGDNITLKDIDNTSITIEKLEGPGSINNATDIVSDALPLNDITTWNQWITHTVTLYGVTAKTRIVIRSTQQNTSNYYRWYLDNVKMIKAPRVNE